jgi:hypothetical protein
MALIQTENQNYLRDTSSRALINNNAEELQLLKAKRNTELKRNLEIESLKKQVEKLTRLILER